MQKVKLDAIDLRILRDLQDDGRITNVDLAARAGISAPPCLRRVRALEEAGFIHGYHAEIDGGLMGYKEMFFALVGLDSQSQTVLTAFEELMASWPEVRECYMLAVGRFKGLLARGRCSNLTPEDAAARIQGEIKEQLKALESVLVQTPAGTQLFDGMVTIEDGFGHTPGHAYFRIKDGSEELVHIADLAHHHLLMLLLKKLNYFQ